MRLEDRVDSISEEAKVLVYKEFRMLVHALNSMDMDREIKQHLQETSNTLGMVMQQLMKELSLTVLGEVRDFVESELKEINTMTEEEQIKKINKDMFFYESIFSPSEKVTNYYLMRWKL